MHQLARFSIARLRSPLDEIPSHSFNEQFELVRDASELADGFVWQRREIPKNNPCSVASLSVWKTPDALESFVQGPVHRPFQLRSDEWFEHARAPQEVVWWVSSLRPPTLAEAAERLRSLRVDGPTLHAFTLHDRFPPN